MKFSVFTESDLSGLNELQPADWGDLVPRFQYFIQSAVCNPVKLSEDDRIIAIGTTMLHNDSAWLACVIVHPDFRNKGIGNKITQYLVDKLDKQKYKTVYLDATDLGYPVYLKIGFEVEAEYSHLRRNTPFTSLPVSGKIVPYSTEYQNSIYQLDQEISGEDRSAILSDFISDAYIFLDNSNIQGFYIPDWGDGPIIARNDIAGIELINFRIQHTNIAVLPSANLSAIRKYEQQGFQFYKFSRRMVLGNRKVWYPERIYNRISGQLG